MKRTHIIGIIIIAVAIAVIVSTAQDSSVYVNFKEATNLTTQGKENNKVHVVGKLKKDASGRIIGMEYQPQVDPNYFVFVLVDENNEERKVVSYNPKPQDFEMSEQVVVVGSMQQDKFVADRIVLKCPSKYQEKEIKVDGAEKVNAAL